MFNIAKLLYIFFPLTISALAAQDPPRIVIIGAGLSGLSTAYYLQDEGIHAEVYDARNRVGGRVFTVYTDEHLVELGGQNINDQGGSNILALIEDLGLETEKKQLKSRLNYIENGQVTYVNDLFKAQKERSAILKAKLRKLEEASENMEEVLKGIFDKDSTLYKACKVLMEADEGAALNKLSSAYSEVIYQIVMENGSFEDANGPEDVEHVLVKGGNGLIAEKIAEALSGHIHLNHVLNAISKNSEGTYELTFNNGEKVSAEILILSIPCPVFNNISIANEVISAERLARIKEVQYGTTAKIILPILPPAKDEGAFTNGRFVTFYSRDKYALTLYYVDEYGRFNDKTIGALVKQDFPLVEKFYKLSSQVSPIAARDQAFSSYKGAVGHSWPNDPYALGSYSCIGVGQEETFTALKKVGSEMVKTLFLPIDGTLFFAGEHTSILLDAGGTMEAAVESGIRTGKMVANIRPLSKLALVRKMSNFCTDFSRNFESICVHMVEKFNEKDAKKSHFHNQMEFRKRSIKKAKFNTMDN